jgi:hypothetical protein
MSKRRTPLSVEEHGTQTFVTALLHSLSVNERLLTKTLFGRDDGVLRSLSATGIAPIAHSVCGESHDLAKR